MELGSILGGGVGGEGRRAPCVFPTQNPDIYSAVAVVLYPTISGRTPVPKSCGPQRHIHCALAGYGKLDLVGGSRV